MKKVIGYKFGITDTDGASVTQTFWTDGTSDYAVEKYAIIFSPDGLATKQSQGVDIVEVPPLGTRWLTTSTLQPDGTYEIKHHDGVSND